MLLLLLTNQRFSENNGGTPETTLADGDVIPLQKASAGRDGHILYSVLKALLQEDVLLKADYDALDDGVVDNANSLKYNTVVYISRDGTKVSIVNEATGVYGIEVKDGSTYLISDTGNSLGAGAKPYCYVNGSSIMTLARMIDYIKRDGTVAMEAGYSPGAGSQDVATAKYVDDEVGAVQSNLDNLVNKVYTKYEDVFFLADTTSTGEKDHKLIVVPAGETWYITSLAYQLVSGSFIDFDLMADGVVVTGFVALIGSTTFINTTASDVALVSGKRLSINILTTSSNNLMATVKIKRVIN